MDTEHMILGLLMLGNRTIYQLRSRIDKGLGMMYSSSTGSIQAAIKKLLNNGFIDCREVQDKGRKKKEYRITEAGRREFCRWINSPIEAAGIKCPELSKFYFLGFSEQENRIGIVREYLAELKRKQDLLEMICDESESLAPSDSGGSPDNEAKDIFLYQLSAARFGRDILSFTVKWYEQFLAEMRQADE